MENFVPVIGSISSQLGELTTTVIQEITNPSKIPLKKLVETAESDPIASACIQLKAARTMQLLRSPYLNQNRQIKDFIDTNIENMNGSLPKLGSRLSSAMPFGFSVAEYSLKTLKNKWVLNNFNVLNPVNTFFRSAAGNVTDIRYHDGGITKTIPTWKCLLVTNDLVTSFGRKMVYGNPEMLRAYPYIRLKQLIYSEMSVAAKRLATGILIGKADSNTTVQLLNEKGELLLDNNGQPRTQSTIKNLETQFKRIETNGYMITDKMNDITAVQVPAGEQFWNLANTMLNEQIMRCFLVPDTIWQQGVATFGTGGLSTNQMNILDSTIQAIVEQITDQIIEKIFKPLITLNFGLQKSYGKFDINATTTDPNMEMQKLSNLMSVLSMGLIPNTDMEAMNMLREKLGLPKTSTEEQKFQAQLQQQMSMIQQTPIEMQPPVEENGGEMGEIQNVPDEQLTEQF